MTLRRRVPALGAAVLTTLTVAACGDDGAAGDAKRPAHRPISVIYVVGDPEGPWKRRTEGLADGVKLAVAERDGLIGERAVSIAVVPTRQRDGANVSASIGAGRVVRDSRAIAILGAYSAPEAAVSAPQFNGGEIALLQFGSGMTGLTQPEAPGEPGRYEPSGERYALRVTPSDELVGARVRAESAFRGAQVVPITATYRASVQAAATTRASAAASALRKAKKDGDDPLPSTDPALTAPSVEIPDADRLAARIAEAVRGRVVSPADVDPSKPTVVVTDSTETDPTAAARAVLTDVRGAALVVDTADRAFDPAVIGRGRSGSSTFQVRRSIAPDDDALARRVRASEREAFGRDRGADVAAGYRAAQRILDLGDAQPDRTIDRVTFARGLVSEALTNKYLQSDDAGDAQLGTVELYRLSGNRWEERPGGRQFGGPRPIASASVPPSTP